MRTLKWEIKRTKLSNCLEQSKNKVRRVSKVKNLNSNE